METGVKKPGYAEACRAFRWEESFRALGWTRDGLVNLGHTLVDRHAGSGRPAVHWHGREGASRSLTFADLRLLTDRFANLLRSLGIGPGDRVAGFLPRVPEVLVAMIGTWKAGAVYLPIFTGFGPDAIEFRVEHGGVKLLCTHEAYRDRVPLPTPATAGQARHSGDVRVLTVGRRTVAGDLDFGTSLEGQPEHFALEGYRRDQPAVLLYTSGSTGPPKGVQIATNFPLAIHPYMVHGVDLRPGDVFWPTGDPGWGYGLVCYMVALALGHTVTTHEAAPAPRFCLERLRDLEVTNLATTPTVLRGIMALGPEVVAAHPVRLRAVSSCGEPLNAEVVEFFRRHWAVTVMDQYGSSEFGLPIGNLNAVEMEVRPGSMGLPLPGARMAVVDDEGREVAPETVGHVGMRPSPDGYYALGYWRDPERTRDLMRGDFITIGDLARRDADGYFWFEGRADDVIKSAGYRIGPFEVESAILRHPLVAEAAVVGKPDALRGHIVKAFVVLRPGTVRPAGIEAEIVDVVKRHLGHHQAPREVEVVAELPKTETGKIQRFLLRGEG